MKKNIWSWFCLFFVLAVMAAARANTTLATPDQKLKEVRAYIEAKYVNRNGIETQDLQGFVNYFATQYGPATMIGADKTTAFWLLKVAGNDTQCVFFSVYQQNKTDFALTNSSGITDCAHESSRKGVKPQ